MKKLKIKMDELLKLLGTSIEEVEKKSDKEYDKIVILFGEIGEILN